MMRETDRGNEYRTTESRVERRALVTGVTRWGTGESLSLSDCWILRERARMKELSILETWREGEILWAGDLN